MTLAPMHTNSASPGHFPNPYFVNLDGLRTIACLLVYMQHGFGPLVGLFADDLGIFSSPMQRLFSAGDLGVSFFFVLSGFLITYLILHELQQTGRLNVFGFWIRRFLRIWPLYYLVILFSIVVYPMMKAIVGYDQYIEIGNPVLYFVFLGNFDVISLGQSRGAMSTNITWSVAIEEQFYLFWPLLFAFVNKRCYKYIFVGVIAVSTAFRFLNADNGMVLYFHTMSVISDMAVGGLAAYLSLTNERFMAAFSRMSGLAIAFAYALGFTLISYGDALVTGPAFASLHRLFFSFFFVFVVLEQNYCRHSIFKMSNRRWLSKLGVYTYGLYLLHPMAIQFMNRLPRLFQLSLGEVMEKSLIGFGGLALSLLLAYLSYHLYERPFLRLKDSFQWTPIKKQVAH